MYTAALTKDIYITIKPTEKSPQRTQNKDMSMHSGSLLAYLHHPDSDTTNMIYFRLSSLDVEENVGTIHLDIIRSQGLLGRVSLDVTTNSGTATFLSSSSNIIVAEFQTIPAAKISAWHVIEAGGTTFVLMLTSLSANEQLRNLLPESSPVEAGQSVLYRWQGELTYVKVSSHLCMLSEFYVMKLKYCGVFLFVF